MDKCDIIVISYNAAKFLEKCIESIKKYTQYPYQIIIVDNDSNIETKNYLKALECDRQITIKYNDSNYGFGYANNQGLELSSSKYVCFLNSDTIVTENWLDRLIQILEDSKAGLIGPVSNYVSSDQQLCKFKYFHRLDNKDDSKIQNFAKEIFEQNKTKIKTTSRLVGFCFLTKREILNKVGNFDDRYEVGNFEDDDLCLRFIERGYSLYCAQGVFIYHYGGKSFEEEFKDQTPDHILDKNRSIHEEKWYQSTRIDNVYKQIEPLKIVYLMASDGPSGGVKVIFEHANRLKARGHDVQIICGVKETKQPWFDVKVPIVYGLERIPDCDIAIGTYFSTLPYLQNINAKVKLHLSQGYEAHLHTDQTVLETIKSNYRITKEKVVVSKWLKDILDKEYEINCNYVGNGIDQYVFSFKEHSRNQKPRILVAGDDGLEIKGINFALDAIRDLVIDKKIDLVRLSGSPQKYTDLPCEFHRMSLMTQKQIAKIYESCDITICASKKVEGFSLPPLESMASGTPVITTDCGGVIDYAKNEINALVVPAEDSKAIRQALDLLLKNQNLYKRLVIEGIKTSRQWLWYKQIDQLEKLFYSLYEKAKKEQTEKVSFCMIVKNEEEHLERCLNSIKNLAAEIIIVDTGSTDRTIQIAKKFGTKIYHYEWKNDFSDARNFALRKVTQPWTFILDADEIIAQKDLEKIKTILKGEKVAYNIVTRNYVNDLDIEKVILCNNDYEEDKDFQGWCSSLKIRLFPTNENIKFEGKVHELVEKSINQLNIPIKNTDFQVLHFGYLKSRLKKDNVYVELGKKKLEENQNDIKSIYELALQYTALNNYDEALVLWRKALQLQPNNHEFLSKMGTTYNLLENYEQAEICFLKALKIKESEYAYRHLGITYAKKNDYQKAYECFKKIVFKTNELKVLGDFAYCCNYLRKFDESIMILEKALKFQRKITLSWKMLEIAYNEKGIELAKIHKHQQALSLFKQALTINPKFEPAMKNIQEVNRVMKTFNKNS